MSGLGFLEGERGWRLSDLLHANNMVLCGESEKDLGKMVGRFFEMGRRRGLKPNTFKSKVMVLSGEEGLECEVHVDVIRLEHVSEFKYLGCILDESGTDGAEYSRKAASGRKVAGAIMFLVNGRNLQLSVLKSCMKDCLYLFLCVAVKQCYGRRYRDLGLGLYR